MSSLLEALGQGGPGGAAMGGPDMSQGEAPGPTEAPDELLQTAVDALQKYVAHTDSDAIETHTATKALTMLQGMLADDLKGQEAASGTTPVHKAMAKQVNSLASQAYGG